MKWSLKFDKNVRESRKSWKRHWGSWKKRLEVAGRAGTARYHSLVTLEATLCSVLRSSPSWGRYSRPSMCVGACDLSVLITCPRPVPWVAFFPGERALPCRCVWVHSPCPWVQMPVPPSTWWRHDLPLSAAVALLSPAHLPCFFSISPVKSDMFCSLCLFRI